MAAKLGFEAIKYVLTKALTKKGSQGIARIPGKAYDMRMGQLVDEMATKMRNLGYDVNEVTEKQVKGLLDSAEALAKQKKSKVISQGDPEFQGITDKLLEKKKYDDITKKMWKDRPFPGANLKAVPKVTVDEHITFIKSKDPIESMKEANKVIKREGRYKNLTNDESQKILKDTDDHIFQRDIQYDEFGGPIKPEPEDFQSGGLAYMLGEPNTRIEALQHAGVIADPKGLYTDPSIYSKGESEIPQNYYEGGRIGYAGGAIVKGGKWMIKNLLDVRQKIKTMNLAPHQMKMGLDRIDDHIRNIKAGGPIPEEAIQAIRKDPKFRSVHQTRSTDPDMFEMEQVVLDYGKKHAEGGRIGLKKGSESWRNKLTRWAGGPSALAGELGLEGIHQLHQLLGMGGLYASGGRIKNFYEGGGVGHGPWTKGQAPGTPEQPPQAGAPMHPAQGQSNPMKLPQGLPSLAPRTMDPRYMQQQQMQQMMGQMGQRQPRMGMDVGGMTQDDFDRYLRERKQRDQEDFKKDFLDDFEDWERYQKERTVPVAEGGRIGFGLGGLSRRTFLKMMAAIAALPLVGKGITKVAPKAIPKVTETIVKSNAPGMPAWFPSLVKRVIKEGKDETAKLATIERQTVHTAKLPTSGTEIQVTRDLITDDVIVDIGYGKHGWPAGRHGQPARLELKKGEWIEPSTEGGGYMTKGGDNVYPGMSKGFSEAEKVTTKPGKSSPSIKSKDEFTVQEAEFTGGHPENVKFEETVDFNYGDHGSDFGEVERFATGKKNIDKKIVGKQREKDNWAEGRAESAADEVDYASGGLAYMLGE